MTTEERGYRDIRKWRPKAARGDGAAISNIEVAYRVLGRFGLSARWFQKAAMMGDGDAIVDYAYCLQHGAGVRPDLTLAKEMYRRAIESDHICENGREEALYLLSVILLRDESDTSRREALKLLKASNVDGDYPVAQRLLEDGGGRVHLSSPSASRSGPCPLSVASQASRSTGRFGCRWETTLCRFQNQTTVGWSWSLSRRHPAP